LFDEVNPVFFTLKIRINPFIKNGFTNKKEFPAGIWYSRYKKWQCDLTEGIKPCRQGKVP
jgi:hypothetical protein